MWSAPADRFPGVNAFSGWEGFDAAHPASAVATPDAQDTAASPLDYRGWDGQDFRSYLALASQQTTPQNLDAEDARRTVIENFGYLDIACNGGARDGLASREDLKAAAASGNLAAADSQTIAKIARDPASFFALDGRDGSIDGCLNWYALQKGAGDADMIQGNVEREIPLASEAHYSEQVYAALAQGQDIAGISAPSLVQRSRIFDAPANDGSTHSVIEAAFTAMLEDYARIDTAAAQPSADDRTRLDFLATMSARGALSNGIALDHGAASVSADLGADFMGSQVLDGAAVEAAYQRLIATPVIQADLTSKVKALVPNAPLLAADIETTLGSSLYAGYLRSLERAGRAEEARDMASQDIAALQMIDPAAAARASNAMLAGMARVMVDEADFTNTPQEISTQAISDILDTMAVLKAGRVGLRVTGQIATMLNSLDDLRGEWDAIRAGTSRLAENLSSLFRATQAAGGKIENVDALLKNISTTFPASEQSTLRRFIIGLDRVGAWQSSAAVFGVVSGVYRFAHPGEHPWDRLYGAQEFLASASYITGPAKMLGHYLEARAGEAASKFNAAIKQPLAILVTGKSSLNLVDLALESGTTPLMQSSTGTTKPPTSATTGSSVPPLTQSSDTLPDGKHRVAAGIVKGFAAATEVGSAVMGIVLGIKQIVDGVNSGSASGQAIGALTLTSGVGTMTGAILSIARAIGTPILVGAGVLSLVGLVVAAATQKTSDQMMADEFAKRWADSGFLRGEYRDNLRQWWIAHSTARSSGMGIDM